MSVDTFPVATRALISCCRELAEVKAERDALRGTCAWTVDDGDRWDTGCGRTWQYPTGGPAENHQVYCHACGGRVVVRMAGEDKQ